jgi:integrase
MKKPLSKVNKLQNRYVTDGNIWTVDDTFFTENICLFVVLNLKTRAILGFVLGHEETTSHYIVELYEEILNNYNLQQKPLFIHSDLGREYYDRKPIRDFLERQEIAVSLAAGDRHQNQVSESINNRIKHETILHLISQDNKSLRALVKTQPEQFKGKSKESKAKSGDYRKWFFTTAFFKQNAFSAITKGIEKYNEREFATGMTRKSAEFFNSKIIGKNEEEFHLVHSKHEFANQIRLSNEMEFTKARNQIQSILDSDLDVSNKLIEVQKLILEGQNATQEIMKMGFGGLAYQNAQLLESNDQLSQQLATLQSEFISLAEELNYLKKQRQEKEALKLARLKRTRLPKRDPMTLEAYDFLIKSIHGKDYRNARLRIALCLLTITGIRINELLPLKVSQLETLVKKNWIEINRSKRGPASHKAYLTRQGKKLLRERQEDFQFIFWIKEPDAYVFTSEYKPNKMLRRESLTKSINTVTRKASEQLPGKPNITSHSFRIGFITQLWKDTQDIEFVRQVIGHVTVQSTSSYVENLSDKEREKKMSQIKSADDLSN